MTETNNKETRTIKGIKITLTERSASSWLTYHRFKDEYGELKPQQSKTFGKKSNAKNINDAFKQAYKWITEEQEKIDSGFVADGNEITLGEYIETEWNPNRPATATYDRYHSQLNMKAFDKIKKMKISAINLKAVKELFEVISKTKSDRKPYKTPSRGSLENYKKALSNVFKSAMANNVVDSNPTLSLEIKRLVDQKHLIEESKSRLENRNAFSKEDMKIILNHLKKVDYQMYVVAKIMVLTGLRTQEVDALDINKSIDFENNCFIIYQAATYVAGRGTTLKQTKTDTPRKVYFNDSVANLLHDQINRKMTELKSLMSKDEISKEDNIFLVSSHREYPNRLYQTQWLSKQFTKYISDLKVKQYQLYSCRHTYATWQLEAGSPAEAIAQNMGHDIKTFYKYYVHDLDDAKRKLGQKDLLNEAI
ncbi:tyrosine-type recombinase/integrase [Companilactobacillus insicii]|uniref:tyrosine-type recombinase/integrase n=1 Tax=Companilactobacillus insicii TaxID=1732567 RepID=UPI0013DDFB71|nr:site-specific integrase [Companilactobacillus insicii]